MVTVQELGLAVKRLQWRHHREVNKRMASLGISISQWDVLRHLNGQPEASLHDLARLTFQTDPSMGTLASRMVSRGLLERLAGPGRAVRHRLTAEGHRVRTAGSEIMDAVMGESFEPLSDRERATLHRLLRKANPDHF